MVQSCEPGGGPGAAFGRAFAAANPGVALGPAPAPPAETHTAQFGSGCQRTVRAGSGFADLLLDPVFVPFEHVFRKLPQDGVYGASRQSPYQFEMGAFTVPRGMSFLLAEYHFQIFRLNGAVAGDAVPLEDRRLPLSVGYDMNTDQFRQGDIQVEIIPINPPATGTQAAQGVVTPPVVDFQAPQVTFPQQVVGATVLPSVYGAPGSAAGAVAPGTSIAAEITRAYVAGVAAGSALLPQESQVQGPSRFPFTYKIDANQAVQLRVVVFAPVHIPLAFFEGRILGYVTPKNTMHAMLAGVKPCS